MKGLVTLSVLCLLIAMASANLFGAGNSLQKRYPGSRPISYAEYQKNLKRHHANRRTTTARPASNWMYQRLASSSPSNRRTSIESDEVNNDRRPITFPSQAATRRAAQKTPMAIHFPNDRELVNQRPVFYKNDKSDEILDASLEYEDFS